MQEQFVEDFNRKTGASVRYIEAPYEPYKSVRMVKDKESTDEKEGGLRCTACFEMCLDIVVKAAVEHGYDCFGSVITLSSKKNAQLVNELGVDAQKIYDVNYLPSDSEKSKDYERSIEIRNDYNIFRQCYYGCVFAAMQQGIDFKAVNREAKTFLEQYPD